MPEPAAPVDEAVAVSVKAADEETPVVEEVAVKVPAAMGVTMVDAVPPEPVVTVLLEKLRLVPVKLTLAPMTGVPFRSFTTATSGAVKADPTMALWPDPETTAILAAGPKIVSVYESLLRV